MPFLLARNWWTLVIRGIIAIIFGILTFVWPAMTLAVLVLLFGAYAFVDGAMNLIGIFRRSSQQERWWALLLEGLVGIAAGLVTFFWPAITALALVYVIAAWALLTGIFEIIAAVRLRQELSGESLLIFSGILSVILAVVFAAMPLLGALSITFAIGTYAIIFGVLMVSLGFRLRSFEHSFGAGTGAMPLPAR
jgi:uncharacterized membrane protein HdeD (DUF308 family)